jgi:hypothetical protein
VPRLPTWLKIAIPIGMFALLVAAAATRVLLERLPEGTLQTVQERYRDEVETLELLAATIPIDPCDEMEPHDLMNQLDSIRAWQGRVSDASAAFADAAILEAAAVLSCGGETINFGVKNRESNVPSWTPTVYAPHTEWPSVSLWYIGLRQAVRYETQVTDPTGAVTTLRLMLDLESLE